MNTSVGSKWWRILGALCLAGMLVGCATTPGAGSRGRVVVITGASSGASGRFEEIPLVDQARLIPSPG
jgi:hypothetical protein